jgi:hypothetical protein
MPNPLLSSEKPPQVEAAKLLPRVLFWMTTVPSPPLLMPPPVRLVVRGASRLRTKAGFLVQIW